MKHLFFASDALAILCSRAQAGLTYIQNFEGLDAASATALSGDGWNAGGIV